MITVAPAWTRRKQETKAHSDRSFRCAGAGEALRGKFLETQNEKRRRPFWAEDIILTNNHTMYL